MFAAADLPETIPVFPLPGALLLPRSQLPLQIFEPRYLAMLDDTLKTTHRLIGMVQTFESAEDGDDRLHHIGCAGRLTGFSETDDGRYMITLKGISRYRILAALDGFTPYRRCAVDWGDFAGDIGVAEKDRTFDRDSFFDLLHRYFEDKSLKTDWESLRQAEDELLINSLSMLCPLAPEDKQALLEAPSLVARRETLVTLMEYALHGGSAAETMQ